MLDLDALERLAKAAKQAVDNEDIAASSVAWRLATALDPDTILALIARVRELEAELATAQAARCPWCGHPELCHEGIEGKCPQEGA